MYVLCTVAAQVVSRSHKFKRADLEVQFVKQEEQKAEVFKKNQLSISGLPEGTTKDVYEVAIAGCLDMEEEDDFELEVSGQSALLTFTEDYPIESNCLCSHNVTVVLHLADTTIFCLALV